MRVEVNVLGPFEVSVDGVSIVPSASKPRRLLAMLAFNAGRAVSTSALIEELWGQSPPPSALATLQTYVLQLRRRVSDALAGHGAGSSKDVLVTTPAGYLLDVGAGAVDAVRYDVLAAEGHRAINDGDDKEAARALGAALALWRGPVLTGIPLGSQLAIEATRLEQSRLSDLDLRIDAELRLGRHQQLIGELSTLCARYPMVENFCVHYMLALYRSGRQWQALQVYRDQRTLLISQLGIEPSRRLRAVHQAILKADPAIEGPAAFSDRRISAMAG